MKKKISKVLLAAFFTVTLAGVSHAYTVDYNKHSRGDSHRDWERATYVIQDFLAKRSYKGNKYTHVETKKPERSEKKWKDDFQTSLGKNGNDYQNGNDYGNRPGWDCPTPSGNNPVPEPATMLLLGAGIAGIAGVRLRKKNK